MLIIGNVVLMYNVNKLKTSSYERLNYILEKCKNNLNIKKKICIKIRNNLQSPCIYGVIKPKILIPKELIKEDDELILNIFMHELSHYKRKDMITNFILLITLLIHWFNPFVYILFKKTRQNIEMATDEMATNKMNKDERKKYGFTLINLLQMYQNQTSASRMLCIADDAKNMEKRIKKIKLSDKNKILILMFAIILIICMLIPFFIKANTGEKELDEKDYNSSMEEYLSIGKKLYTIIEDDVWRGNWTKNVDGTKNENLIINCENLDQYKQNMTETVFNEYIKYFNITKNGNKYIHPTGYAANPRFISDDIEIQNKLDNKVNFNVNAKYEGDNGEIVTRIFSFVIVKENDRWIISQYHCPFFENSTILDNTVNSINEETVNIIGKWQPYVAQKNGKNVELNQIYGTSISTYGGYLTFNKDGTYTKFIGVYSQEQENNLQGIYMVNDNIIELISYNKEKEAEKLEIIKKNEYIIKEEIDGYTIFFKREEELINKAKDDIESKYILDSKYIGDWREESNDANGIIIKSVNGNMFSFDLSMHRIYEFENLTATMISEDTATFNTNDNNDAGDTWKGVYGTLKFEKNYIRMNIKKSDCEYIDAGLEFTYKFN